MSERIDYSRFTGVAVGEEVTRQIDPRREMRPAAEKERPDYYQRSQERERGDGSSWSGASAGGGIWAGRSR
jgi:hypothetical protein